MISMCRLCGCCSLETIDTETRCAGDCQGLYGRMPHGRLSRREEGGIMITWDFTAWGDMVVKPGQ